MKSYKKTYIPMHTETMGTVEIQPLALSVPFVTDVSEYEIESGDEILVKDALFTDNYFE